MIYKMGAFNHGKISVKAFTCVLPSEKEACDNSCFEWDCPREEG